MTKTYTKNDTAYEGRISLTIDALKNQKVKGVRRAARLFDVSEATLWSRLNGVITQKKAGIERQKMTNTGEASLRSWIFSLERSRLPPRPLMLQKMAIFCVLKVIRPEYLRKLVLAGCDRF